MTHDWDHYFLRIAGEVASRNMCLKRNVGAVLVRDRRIIATGYNGTPSGATNCVDGGCHRCAHADEFPAGVGYEFCVCLHAEQNALLVSARHGVSTVGSVCYSTLEPCISCLKELRQAGVVGVVFRESWVAPSAAVAGCHAGLRDWFGEYRQVDWEVES